MYYALLILTPLIPGVILNIAYIFVPSVILNGFWIFTREYMEVAIFLLDLLVILGFAYVIYRPKYNLLDKFYIFSTNILGLIVICANYYLKYQEAIKFPNYVYSTYHLYLPALSNLSGLLILLILITLIRFFSSENELTKVLKKSNGGVITQIINWVVILILGLTLLKIPEVILSDTSNVIKHISFLPVLMPDMPVLRNQLLEIQKRTPPDSIIVHPDQSVSDPELGNQVLIRYILYPRTLVSESKYNLYLQSKRPIDKIFRISAKPLKDLRVYYANPKLPLYIYE